jgi:eukaryotic-like serine/threonine-protein kinase
MPLSAGERLGPYEIIALIGAGGMGEVYRATDTRLRREVAIKISHQQFTERFDREARAIASLNHPNICSLFDIGPNFLVMEYVEGEAPKGPLPLEEALRIARQIGDALSEAHEKGITHRDLKPANVKIKPDGTVKVLDFGLAKMTEPPQAASQGATQSPTLSMAATQAGMILGTAAYMAPEQAKGKPVDRRADIWAFGVVVYELLTGKRLFEADDITETLAAVVLKEPQWDGVPVEVRRLLKKCLEKDPKKRLRDIGDVWELLEAPSVTTGAPAVLAGTPGRSTTILAAVAAVVTLALAALAFVHFRETPPPEHTLRYTLAPPEGMQNIHSFAVSPDGRTIAMAAVLNGKRQLWQRQLDALQWQPMPFTEDATYPFWSPDSRNIGFFADGKLRKIAASGGPSQPLCDAADGRGGSWNRDDVIVFSPSGSADNVIQRVPAAGGVPADVIKTRTRFLFPGFLPDGRHFLYETAGISEEKNGIYIASLDGKENRRVLADASSVVFAPSGPGGRAGHLLFLRESNLMAQPFDAGSLQTSGDVFPVAEGMSLANGNNFAPVSASDNGVLLYWTGGVGGGPGSGQVVWYDRGGKAEAVGTPGNVLQPAISPDEKTIAFARGPGGASRDIWLRDLVRGNERRLTTDGLNNQVPFWSPKNGDRIVYRSSRGGHPGDLYLKASSGAGQDEPLLSTPNAKIVDQWSRDGRFIVYTEQDPKTKNDLWVLSMGGDGKPSGKPMPFLHSGFNELHGQLSPDSRWMAYTSDVSGQGEVYVQPFPVPDNEVRISLAGGGQPRWSGDGKELFYLAADGKLTVVAVTVAAGPKPSLKPGAPMALFDAHLLPTNSSFNYDVTADGKRFLVITNASAPVSTGSSAPPLTVRVNWNAASKK